MVALSETENTLEPVHISMRLRSMIQSCILQSCNVRLCSTRIVGQAVTPTSISGVHAVLFTTLLKLHPRVKHTLTLNEHIKVDDHWSRCRIWSLSTFFSVIISFALFVCYSVKNVPFMKSLNTRQHSFVSIADETHYVVSSILCTCIGASLGLGLHSGSNLNN